MLSDAVWQLFATPTLVFATLGLVLVAMATTMAGYWKAFEKAGEPGWAALVPLYNLWVLCRIGRCARFWFWLSFVPIVNAFAFVPIVFGVADQFGRGVAFGLALLVVPWVAWPLLGFAGFEHRPNVEVNERASESVITRQLSSELR